MPRFYFHIRTGDTLHEDPEGEEFSTAKHAVDEAVLAARELIAAKVIAGEAIDGQVFEITAEDGQVVGRLPFKSVVSLD